MKFKHAIALVFSYASIVLATSLCLALAYFPMASTTIVIARIVVCTAIGFVLLSLFGGSYLVWHYSNKIGQNNDRDRRSTDKQSIGGSIPRQEGTDS